MTMVVDDINLRRTESLIEKIEIIKKAHLEGMAYDWDNFKHLHKVLGESIVKEDMFSVHDLAKALSGKAEKLMKQRDEAISMGLLGNLKDFEDAHPVTNAPLEIILRFPLCDEMTVRSFVFLTKPGVIDIANGTEPDLHKRLKGVIKRACPSAKVGRYDPFGPYSVVVTMGRDYTENRKRGDLILEMLLKYINKNYSSEATWHEADTYVRTCK